MRSLLASVFIFALSPVAAAQGAKGSEAACVDAYSTCSEDCTIEFAGVALRTKLAKCLDACAYRESRCRAKLTAKRKPTSGSAQGKPLPKAKPSASAPPPPAAPATPAPSAAPTPAPAPAPAADDVERLGIRKAPPAPLPKQSAPSNKPDPGVSDGDPEAH